VGSRLLIFVCFGVGVGVVVAKARCLGVLCHWMDARGRRPVRTWIILSTCDGRSKLSPAPLRSLSTVFLITLKAANWRLYRPTIPVLCIIS
jgi:hypothetical protein